MAGRVCNLYFEGEIPPEVLVRAAITECKHVYELPGRFEVTVYYDPECAACKRLFQFLMELGNIRVRAKPVQRYALEVVGIVGRLVVPVTVASAGRYMRGCPPDFGEFLTRLCGLLGIDPVLVESKGGR